MAINWIAVVEGGIPFLAGLYATAMAYGFVTAPVFTQSATGQKLRAQLRWLGPVLMIFGLYLGWDSFLVSTSSQAEAVAAGIRSRLTLPVMVDDATRLDAVEGKAAVLTYRLTVVSRLKSREERETIGRTLKEQLLQNSCSHPDYRKLLQTGLTLELRYHFEGSTEETAIVIAPGHCGYAGT